MAHQCSSHSHSLPHLTSTTPDAIDPDARPATVQTGISIDEHTWLHRLFKSPDCIAVAMSIPDGDALILGQARINLRDRAARSRGLQC